MDCTTKNYYYYYLFKPISDLIVNRYLEISPSVQISMYCLSGTFHHNFLVPKDLF